MKIVLAFDSFKGSITAQEACHTAALAIKDIMPNAVTIECPLSDGGEGLVDCVERIYSSAIPDSLHPTRITFKAHDPLMNTIDASYILSADGTTAYMEMAATSGLTLVPKEKRNPLLTTTYGVGDMIADAAKRGCKEIVMGIGGSATCDGGKGMIESLRDKGYSLPCPTLPKITVASDVTNPLYGIQGAAYIFGPQKGATSEQVVELDNMLRSFARDTEKAGLSTPEMANYPGAGAAGGLGYSLMSYLKAELKSGIDIILDIIKFDIIADGADLVITGEGKSDEQTLMGKVPHGLLGRCQKRGIPLWLLSGCIDDRDCLLSQNFSLVKSINDDDNSPLEMLMLPDVAKRNLARTIEHLLAKQKIDSVPYFD